MNPKEWAEVREYSARLVGDIADHRKKLGIGQIELAEIAGVTQKSICNMETGKTMPRLDTLFRIALALGIKITFTPFEVSQ